MPAVVTASEFGGTGVPPPNHWYDTPPAVASSCAFPAHKRPVCVIDTDGGVVVETGIEVVPPQLEALIIPGPCISYVAVLVPWPLINVAAGVLLQLNDPEPPDAVT